MTRMATAHRVAMRRPRVEGCIAGGAAHRRPDGGGPVAAIARRA
jgi:hypothetical protein